ncbi:MAG TPA: integrase core domain-containing protein [Anaerolineae bacterium]|nr:integrase core domain-containing protein [Anaerolineae bacterium]
MFYYLLLLFLSPLYALLGRLLLYDRDREIVALRQQLSIMQRRLGKRPSLVPAERLALVLSSLHLARHRLLGAMMIVTPATVVGWHRKIVARHWTLLSGRKPGRPRSITPEMKQLVLRIARENRRWGYTKIAGEMRKLGFSRFGRSTVARILKRHGLTPARRRGVGLSWVKFFAHYGRFIWASDYLTVTTATLRTYYVIFFLFFLDIATRRIVFWNVSISPDEAWVAQQFRNLSVVNDELPRYLIQDRDSKYTLHADSLLEGAGTKVIRLPVRSPDLNAYAERWIRSLREECLDRIIVLNEAHLRWALREYTSYYNARRPHRSLRLLPPEAHDQYPSEGPILRQSILGGLINDYCRQAA